MEKNNPILKEEKNNKDRIKKSILEESKKIEIENKEELIKTVVQYRKTHSLNQSEFSARIGISQQALSRFEKAGIDPRLSFIVKLSNAMGCKIIFKEI